MVKKIEYEINTSVANFMLEQYPWITNVSVPIDEDYYSYDISYTGQTKSGEEFTGTQEVKSIMNYPLKENGEFRKYFKYDIKNKMRFGSVPSPNEEIPEYWIHKPSNAPMPDNIKDAYVYILNASDSMNNLKNCKWNHMMENKTGLTIVASDGIIMFNHKQLKSAFLGYAWYLNKSHTELYDKYVYPHYELKAIIDLTKGTYYPNIVDNNLLKK